MEFSLARPVRGVIHSTSPAPERINTDESTSVHQLTELGSVRPARVPMIEPAWKLSSQQAGGVGIPHCDGDGHASDTEGRSLHAVCTPPGMAQLGTQHRSNRETIL